MKKIVTTSWDDGHILDLRLAALLQKYHLAATFYISPASREFSKKDLLSEQEIRLLGENFEIGGHTLHHLNLAHVPLERAVEDIQDGKDRLESIIGQQLQSFAYPYGAYTAPVQKAVFDAGFVVARTTRRFSLAPSSVCNALPTTVHVYTHLSDIVRWPRYRTIQWPELARYLFDQTMANGGVFHLWGHSWEIDKYHQWENLETILEYIANREDVAYVNNRSLV
ncbi:MAG TPA: polysaccharide deacetylase family protein [Ktedonobacteraceae bacterium]|nr:polysaccharide deacetylase family protein [Ktedonobacteraceae bacterium]